MGTQLWLNHCHRVVADAAGGGGTDRTLSHGVYVGFEIAIADDTRTGKLLASTNCLQRGLAHGPLLNADTVGHGFEVKRIGQAVRNKDWRIGYQSTESAA